MVRGPLGKEVVFGTDATARGTHALPPCDPSVDSTVGTEDCPFLDGNQRVGLMVGAGILARNGHGFHGAESEVPARAGSSAAGELPAAALATEWGQIPCGREQSHHRCPGTRGTICACCFPCALGFELGAFSHSTCQPAARRRWSL